MAAASTLLLGRASESAERVVGFFFFSDKATIIHPTSTNATVQFGQKSGASTPRESWERFVVAYGEKSRNVAAGQPASSGTTFLRNVTRLDGLQYMLFGAYKIEETAEGVECDSWLPIQGGARGSLAQIAELKTAFERCMQRVFEGIHASNVDRRQAKLKRIASPGPAGGAFDRRSSLRFDDADADADRDAEAAEEHELEDENDEGYARRIATPLSSGELMELGYLSRDVVGILDSFSEDRKLFRMRSRPATPTSGYTSSRASPNAGSGRLELPGTSAFARGLRANRMRGADSPLSRSPMPSRPSTPYSEGRHRD